MEKMYAEMQGGFKSVDVRLDKMDGRLDRLEAGQISLEYLPGIKANKIT